MRTGLHTVVAALLLSASTATAQTQSLTNAGQIWHGTQPGAQAGAWIDLGAVGSGDSRTDLIIGAPGSASIPGAVYVIFGGPVRTGDLSLANADTSINGAAAGDRFGATTAAGNVITPETSATRNLVVGAPGAMGGRGIVYVFMGGFTLGSHLTTANATYTIIGNTGDQLGTALATADLDNDGFREIIIGAGGNDGLYVIKGGASLSGTRNLSTTPADLAIGGVGLGDVTAAGDVTGDGISDLLIGSGDLNTVFVYKGRPAGGLPTTPDLGFSGARAGDRAGASIRLLDIDHDGIRDIIIGAPDNDGAANNRGNAGATYMIWGGPSLASRSLSQADVIFYGATAGQQLGTHISAGDINRDTPSDIVMTAPGGGGSAGELDIYYGRSNRSAYGVDGGGGQRIVDFADPANIDRRIVGDASLGAVAFTQVFEVTGEGARDIVASVPSQDSGTGAVYFTISPSLGLSTSAVTMAVNRNGSATSPAISITNRSIVGVTWSASSNQPWLTPTPATGSSTSATPGQVSAAVNTAGMAPGPYSGIMTMRSTSKHLEMAIPVTVNLIISDARLAIDTPAGGSTVTQPFTMAGWAIDLGSSSGTGVDAIHVYAFRNDGSGAAPVFLGVAAYGAARPDIGAAFGARFTNSGYSLRVAGLTAGPYRLVAFAHSAVSGTFAVTAEQSVTINPSPLPPGGDYDGDSLADLTLYKPNGDWAIRTSSSNYTSSITKSWGGAGYTVAPGDYDGDGKRDLGVYRDATGDWYVLKSSTSYTTTFSTNWGGAGYKAVPGDYDGDGKTDPAVYNTTSGVWYIKTSSSGYTSSINVSWGGQGYAAVGGQDFDGDAKADVAVYNQATGYWYILTSSSSYTSALNISWGGRGYTLVPGDYDGDGKADLGLYQRATGRWSVLKSSTGYSSTIDVNWGGIGYLPVPADYDGDGKIDLGAFQQSTGNWFVLKSSTGYATSFTVNGWGTSSDTPVSSAIAVGLGADDTSRAADYDGDARADITVYNATAAYWYTLQSSANYTTAMNTGFGGSGYAPVPGDFDGDGKADRALYQASTGNWYVLLSSTNFTTSLSKSAGGSGWTAVPGDYDGDGKTDFVVYNTSSGLWYGLKSSTNYTTTLSVNWGGSGYTAAPADFDADGKADLALYQASTGNWYVLLSASGYTTTVSRNVGGSGYVPVQGDYDGDGKADFVVYNTTTGVWYGLKSSTNYTTSLSIGWGGTGYMPVKGDYDGDGRADLGIYQPSSGTWYILLSGGDFTTSMSKNWGGAGYTPVPTFQ